MNCEHGRDLTIEDCISCEEGLKLGELPDHGVACNCAMCCDSDDMDDFLD